MPTDNQTLQQSLDAVVFDCDGTLSAIEGIDVLAEQNGVGEVVKSLTNEAMEQTGLNVELYRHRLELVRPTVSQVTELGNIYLQNASSDAAYVIQILQNLNKSIYIMSAGIQSAVSYFGKALNIPENNIFGVNIIFDENGNYKDFDHASPLVTAHGKRDIINILKKRHQHIAHVGDGLNDLSVKDLVTRFIGYGGIYYRKNIEAKCDYYVKSPSMTALLPYLLTKDELASLPLRQITL